MAVLTKAALVEKFNNAIKNGDKYIGVRISMPNAPEPEIIINPKENFDGKLAYYEKSYDDSLSLNHCKDIRIIACASGNTVAAVAKAIESN